MVKGRDYACKCEYEGLRHSVDVVYEERDGEELGPPRNVRASVYTLRMSVRKRAKSRSPPIPHSQGYCSLPLHRRLEFSPPFLSRDKMFYSTQRTSVCLAYSQPKMSGRNTHQVSGPTRLLTRIRRSDKLLSYAREFTAHDGTSCISFACCTFASTLVEPSFV